MLQVSSAANAELLSTIQVDVTVDGSATVDADDALHETAASTIPETSGEHSVQLVIFKSNDDLRQEMFAMLMIHIIRSAWLSDGLDLYLREYRVLSTSPSSGLVEVVPDSSSIDALKKSNGCLSLARHFDNSFGAGSAAHERAVNAYISSLAGYSLVSYLLNIKDRHNGNILLQRDGHLVHIDFGFFFSIAPGGITFESAPFKMTRDFYELVGPDNMSNPKCVPVARLHACVLFHTLCGQIQEAGEHDGGGHDQRAQARRAHSHASAGASPSPIISFCLTISSARTISWAPGIRASSSVSARLMTSTRGATV